MANITRLYYHLKRFKGNILYLWIIYGFFALLYNAIYLGDDAVSNFVDLLGDSPMSFLFSSGSSVAWLMWAGIIITTMGYYIAAIAGIMIGAKIVPTKETLSVEMYLGNSGLSARVFYLENLVVGIFALIIGMLPGYIVTVLFSFNHDASSYINNIWMSAFVVTVEGIVFLTVTSFITVVRFSEGWAKGIGYFYVIYATLVASFAHSDPAAFGDYGNIDMNTYLSPVETLFSNTVNWEGIWSVMGIALVAIFLTYLLILRPDYIEKAGKHNGKSVFSPITAIFAPKSFLGRKFPVFTEQIRRDLKTMSIMLILIVSVIVMVLKSIPDPTQLGDVLASSESPIILAMMGNHAIQHSLLGFLVVKFYANGWLYFGLITAFIAASIPTREVSTASQDIVWAAPITPIQVIKARIIAMLLEITVLIWVAYLLISPLEKSSNVVVNANAEIQAYTLFWLTYMAFGIFLTGVAMIPKVSKGRNTAILMFVGMIILNIFSFLSAPLNIFKYFTIQGYTDPVGILYGTENYGIQLISGLFILFVSAIFTYAMTKYRYEYADLI